jgi:hypothetical protein
MKVLSIHARTLIAAVLALMTFVCCSSLSADTIPVHAIQSVTLEEGDAFIHGLAYLDGYIWASTRTKPCRILRIDPDTLDYERIIPAEDALEGEDMVAASGALWIILYGPPSKVLRLDPDTLDVTTVVQFSREELLRGGALVYAFGSLWAGGGDGRIARIDTENYGYEIYDFSTALGRLQIHALAEGGGFLWAASPLYWKDSEKDNESIVLRINPQRPEEYAAVFLRNLSASDDMVHQGGRLFLGSEEGDATVVSIAADLTWRSEGNDKSGCNGLFAQGTMLWGALHGEPGGVIRLDPDSATHDYLLLPEGLNHANELVFDPTGNSLFISCWENPTKIVRVDLSGIEQSLIISLADR